MTGEMIERVQTHRNTLLVAVGVMASLGFAILWRRGGDSPAALWAGIHVSGISTLYAMQWRHLTHEATFGQIGTQWQSLDGKVLTGVAGLVVMWSALLSFLAICGIAAWMVYLNLRPQPVVNTGRHKWRQLLESSSIFTIGMIFVALGLERLSDEAQFFLLPVTTFGAIGLIYCLELERRRSYELRPLVDSRMRLDRNAVGLFAVSLCIMALAPLISPDATGTLRLTPWLAIGSYFVFWIAVVLFLLRTDWLRLASGRDLSWLATSLVLPILFEVFNGQLPVFLDKVGIFMPGAASLASLLLVVALLQPIQRTLESAFVAISSPMLRKISKRVSEILEDAITSQSAPDVPAQFRQLFSEIGISGYSLWLRDGPCAFKHEMSSRPLAVHRLFLSASLCQRIGAKDIVIDLDSVNSEWDYFFDQFELHEIAQRTAARYVYPIRFGDSFWGLLLLEDSLSTRGLAKNSFAATASQIGVALSKWRAQ